MLQFPYPDKTWKNRYNDNRECGLEYDESKINNIFLLILVVAIFAFLVFLVIYKLL